jgi:predicted nicotinamide N-methyase
MCAKEVWPTAPQYIHGVSLDPYELQGKRVLELGAGIGLVGLALAHAGASVICTDLPQVIPVLQHNIQDACTKVRGCVVG